MAIVSDPKEIIENLRKEHNNMMRVFNTLDRLEEHFDHRLGEIVRGDDDFGAEPLPDKVPHNYFAQMEIDMLKKLYDARERFIEYYKQSTVLFDFPLLASCLEDIEDTFEQLETAMGTENLTQQEFDRLHGTVKNRLDIIREAFNIKETKK